MASIARRPDGTYRPRYRDESGKDMPGTSSERPTLSGGSTK
jgi:hypothetical protein